MTIRMTTTGLSLRVRWMRLRERLLGVVLHPFTHIGWATLGALYVAFALPDQVSGLAHLGFAFLAIGVARGFLEGGPPET